MQRHDAFISYRRSDGARTARWLRQTLQGYRLPKALRAGRPDRLNVFLDAVYERGVSDFYERTLYPALMGSRHLIVVATPDAAKPRENDWMAREIADFSGGPNGDNIIVVRGAGAFDGPLPGNILERHPNVQIMDLREAGRGLIFMPQRAARLARERLKIVAPLFEIRPAEMPALAQEDERQRRWRLGLASGAAAGVALVAIGVSAYAIQAQVRSDHALRESVTGAETIVADVYAETSQFGHAADRQTSAVLLNACDVARRLTDQSGTDLAPLTTQVCDAESLRSALPATTEAPERTLVSESARLLEAADVLLARRIASSDARSDWRRVNLAASAFWEAIGLRTRLLGDATKDAEAAYAQGRMRFGEFAARAERVATEADAENAPALWYAAFRTHARRLESLGVRMAAAADGAALETMRDEMRDMTAALLRVAKRQTFISDDLLVVIRDAFNTITLLGERPDGHARMIADIDGLEAWSRLLRDTARDADERSEEWAYWFADMEADRVDLLEKRDRTKAFERRLVLIDTLLPLRKASGEVGERSRERFEDAVKAQHAYLDDRRAEIDKLAGAERYDAALGMLDDMVAHVTRLYAVSENASPWSQLFLFIQAEWRARIVAARGSEAAAEAEAARLAAIRAYPGVKDTDLGSLDASEYREQRMVHDRLVRAHHLYLDGLRSRAGKEHGEGRGRAAVATLETLLAADRAWDEVEGFEPFDHVYAGEIRIMLAEALDAIGRGDEARRHRKEAATAVAPFAERRDLPDRTKRRLDAVWALAKPWLPAASGTDENATRVAKTR